MIGSKVQLKLDETYQSVLFFFKLKEQTMSERKGVLFKRKSLQVIR